MSISRPAAGRSGNKSAKAGLELSDSRQRPFTKTNFLIMAACVGLIIVGFLLMGGGGSSIEEGFNPDIFSTRRIVVGPTVAFLGFMLMAFAIIYTPGSRRKKSAEADNNAED